MRTPTFYTTSYRGYHIHCTSEGNHESCRIQDPDLSTVATVKSVDAAKRKIRKLKPAPRRRRARR